MSKQQSPVPSTMYGLAVFTAVILFVIVIGFIFLRQKEEFIEGQAEVNEFRVSSKVPGRIHRIYVTEGQRVKAGDTLVSLSAPDVIAKLTQVEAMESAARALNQKSHSPARREVLQETYEMWQKALAGLTVAEKSYLRVQRLYQEGVMTAQQYDEALANYEAMVATEKAAHWQYKMAQQGAQMEDKEITAAQLREAEGGVEEVNSYVVEMILLSPDNGEVSEIYPQRDELVGSGAPIMSIALTDKMWASFNVREDRLGKLNIGQKFTAYSPALQKEIPLEVTSLNDMGTYAAWKATRVNGQYDLKTFEVKAIPLTPVEGLRPGMSLVIRENPEKQ